MLSFPSFITLIDESATEIDEGEYELNFCFEFEPRTNKDSGDYWIKVLFVYD